MITIFFCIISEYIAPTTPVYAPIVYYFSMEKAQGLSLIGDNINGAMAINAQFVNAVLVQVTVYAIFVMHLTDLSGYYYIVLVYTHIMTCTIESYTFTGITFEV